MTINLDEGKWRDEVAMRMLQAMVTSSPVVDRSQVDKAKWSDIAYQWADHMLVAREGNTNTRQATLIERVRTERDQGHIPATLAYDIIAALGEQE